MGPGVLEHPEIDNSVGLLPLTFSNPVISTSSIEGREDIYATDQSMLTWWQPKNDDRKKQLTIDLCSLYWVEASRIIWRDVGLDYDNGVLPGPFGYTIEVNEDGNPQNWRTAIDLSANEKDLCIDYKTFEPAKASYVRLTINSTPKGIEPGVISFTVFGKRA